MRRGIDGRTAVIETVDAVGLRGFEFAHLPLERVEELDGHEREKERVSLTGFPRERNGVFAGAGRRGRTGPAVAIDQQPQAVVRVVVV
ncbi:hypothetical protein MASR2M8_17660 [Opitutaceae bacterium]